MDLRLIIRLGILLSFVLLINTGCGKKVSCTCTVTIKDQNGNTVGDKNEFDNTSDTGYCTDLNTVSKDASNNIVTTNCEDK